MSHAQSHHLTYVTALDHASSTSGIAAPFSQACFRAYQVSNDRQHGRGGVVVENVELARSQALMVHDPLANVSMLVLHGQAHAEVGPLPCTLHCQGLAMAVQLLLPSAASMCQSSCRQQACTATETQMGVFKGRCIAPGEEESQAQRFLKHSQTADA